jgi:hypothetical protein
MAEAYANEVQESAKVMNQDIRIINVEKESICWFCCDGILFGDPVYGNQNESPPLARSFENRKPSDKLLGVTTVNVYNIDLTKQSIPPFSVQSGCKISILTVGEIVIYKKYKKIPFGQPMYISKKGNITWRNHGERIGTTSSRQDKDGFLKVKIKIKD